MAARVTSAQRGSPGWALAVIATGVLITAVDTTIVVLALPHIQRSLHASLSSVVWIIVSYLLVITLLSTQVGRLGDIFGRVRMYEAGFVVFVVGSLLCALAWSEPAMIGFRVLQGVGGALIAANSGAVIADTFPPERRGRAYGFNAVGWNIGALIGIVLGGLITTYLSWRWVFWINVPIGIAALLVALRVLRERGERQARTLDFWGMGLLGAGLFAILWAMIELSSSPFDAPIAAGLVAGAVLLVAFVLVERHVREPMIALRLFRIPTMSSSLLGGLLSGARQFRHPLSADHVPAGRASPDASGWGTLARPGLSDRRHCLAVRGEAGGPLWPGLAGDSWSAHLGRGSARLHPTDGFQPALAGLGRQRDQWGWVGSVLSGQHHSRDARCHGS